MACLKCGRETDQTFCECCRETMEKYPVKPGTFVFIPREHKAKVTHTPVRVTTASLERKIAAQKRLMNRLAVAVIVLVVLLTILSVGIFQLLRSSREKPLGQNYSTVTESVDAGIAPASLDPELELEIADETEAAEQ